MNELPVVQVLVIRESAIGRRTADRWRGFVRPVAVSGLAERIVAAALDAGARLVANHRHAAQAIAHQVANTRARVVEIAGLGMDGDVREVVAVVC